MSGLYHIGKTSHSALEHFIKRFYRDNMLNYSYKSTCIIQFFHNLQKHLNINPANFSNISKQFDDFIVQTQNN